jgi:ADP-heptose:LPS heptosyltransferase
MSNRVLICRLGAIGDCIIITPLIHALSDMGREVFVLTSEVGADIFRNNPFVSKIITHAKDSIPNDKLGDYFKATAQAYDCGKVIDLCESIEVRLALHPSDPKYKYTKPERAAICDKNYYSETIKIAEDQLGECIQCNSLIPEFYPTTEEKEFMRDFFSQFVGKFIVLWGMSGSARQKTYPYVYEAMQSINALYDDVHFITVGDESCQILETILKTIHNVTPLSGKWNIRRSILACDYASCVISPDTGLLHGSGCYSTPKIALLTATSARNICETFQNIYPIESQGVSCAPCFFLIYDADNQCNLGANKMPMCMEKGIPVSSLIKEFNFIHSNFNRYNPIEVVA